MLNAAAATGNELILLFFPLVLLLFNVVYCISLPEPFVQRLTISFQSSHHLACMAEQQQK
jgi:hypothetical protein